MTAPEMAIGDFEKNNKIVQLLGKNDEKTFRQG